MRGCNLPLRWTIHIMQWDTNKYNYLPFLIESVLVIKMIFHIGLKWKKNKIKKYTIIHTTYSQQRKLHRIIAESCSNIPIIIHSCNQSNFNFVGEQLADRCTVSVTCSSLPPSQLLILLTHGGCPSRRGLFYLMATRIWEEEIVRNSALLWAIWLY